MGMTTAVRCGLLHRIEGIGNGWNGEDDDDDDDALLWIGITLLDGVFGF